MTLFKSISWFILFTLLWASGCTIPDGSTPTISYTQTLISSATKTPKPITDKVKVPTHTLTYIPKQNSSTPSPTNSSTPKIEIPTQTPAPTLPFEEAKTLALELLRDNGDCRLPCWWGIMPGETSLQEMRSFLEKFGSISDGSMFKETRGIFSFRIPLNNLLMSPNLTYQMNIDNNSVQLLWIQTEVVDEGFEILYGDPLFTELAQYYMLPQILSAYGRPTEVFVWANRFPRQLYLLLNYAQEGFMINYIAPMKLIGEKLSSCPSNAYIELWLWPPEQEYSPAEAEDLISGFGDEWIENFLPLEDATSMTQEEFYTIFSDPYNTSCLETPLDIWPEP